MDHCTAAIEVEHLKHVYRSRTGLVGRKTREIRALDDISFAIKHNEFFGLLGPNGAGKTTLIKILATILMPTSGNVRLRGFDIVRAVSHCRPLLGIVLGGDRGLYWRLSGRSNLEYHAALYQMPPQLSRRRIDESLRMVGLTDRAEERVENYSRGMRQRLHIARALTHDPPLLIMDEPTIGLDPVAAHELRAIIRDLRQRGKTIFLATHYMHEAEELCDRVAILHQGKMLLCDDPATLKSSISDLTVVEFETFGVSSETIVRIQALPSVKTVIVQTREHVQLIQVQFEEGDADIAQLLQCLNETRVSKILTREPTLEDAYLRLVGSEGYTV